MYLHNIKLFIYSDIHSFILSVIGWHLLNIIAIYCIDYTTLLILTTPNILLKYYIAISRLPTFSCGIPLFPGNFMTYPRELGARLLNLKDFWGRYHAILISSSSYTSSTIYMFSLYLHQTSFKTLSIIHAPSFHVSTFAHSIVAPVCFLPSLPPFFSFSHAPAAPGQPATNVL